MRCTPCTTAAGTHCFYLTRVSTVYLYSVLRKLFGKQPQCLACACGKIGTMPSLPKPLTTPACPCRTEQGPPLAYADCCGRYHTGSLALQAPNAEALMRSRYSAFVLNLPDYLLATWHPSTRPPSLDLNEPGLKWLGLNVKAFHVQDATHATVEFIARSKQGGRAQRLQEVSRFVLEEGRWFYLVGDGE